MPRVDVTCLYTRVPVKPSKAFPNKTETRIPLFRMAVGVPGGGSVGFFGMLDSGAEHVIFKSDIADALGLDWQNAPIIPIQGIGGRVTGHAMDVTLAIPGCKYTERPRH